MFEIHVNIRGLIAFARYEALKQQVDLLGIDFGNVQAVANNRIGS